MNKEELLGYALASLESLYEDLNLKKHAPSHYSKRMTYRYGKRAAMPYRFGKRGESEDYSDILKSLLEQQDNREKRLTYRYGK